MPKADTSVKWFDQSFPEAPTLSGEVGRIIGILDALLVTGFCNRTPSTLLVVDGVATATFGAAAPYPQHSVVKIEGASVAQLNGEWRVAANTGSAITFLCPDIENAVVTGASFRFAPAGWEKAFAGGNVAAYRSKNLASTGFFLQVDDSQTFAATVRGFEAMTSVSAGQNGFPLSSGSAFYWNKSTNALVANPAVREWFFAADDRFMFFAPRYNPQPYTSIYAGHAGYGFGDLSETVPSDAFATTLIASSNGGNEMPGGGAAGVYDYGSSGISSARTASGLAYAPSTPLYGTPIGFGKANTPSPTVRYFPRLAAHVSDTPQHSGIRGAVPGLYTAGSIPDQYRIGVSTYSGRAYYELRAGAPFSSYPAHQFAVDITGPWR
jgi:hypothetical protein